jgi:iron(III) transport system substrate-binding protein
MVVLPQEDGMNRWAALADWRSALRLTGGLRCVFLLLLVPLLLNTYAAPNRQVIIYCAQDQLYAEPIFKDFEKETGIRVRPVWDNEGVKTVGLANRLLAERYYPQCDIFWANEEMRARQLAADGIFLETNGLATFGYRSRRLVINTNLLSMASAPHSLLELTNPAWRGKVALAYPQFGTTATHFHVLRQVWGDAAWQSWCRQLAANKPFLVDGNSVVVKLVGRGEAWLGMTDSDDIAEGQDSGLPVMALPMNNQTLLIPNAVAIVHNSPNPDAARKLYDFLMRPEVAKRLVAAHALESTSPNRGAESTLKPDWPTLLHDLETTTEELNKIFLR